VVVSDCGTLVNPTIVEGQIHGGVAQGLGAALLEEIVHRADGEPLTTTLLDYLVPTADVMPSIEIEHLETPAPHTPGGMKGMGEGGTNGAFAAVANAVAAARCVPGEEDMLVDAAVPGDSVPARAAESRRPDVRLDHQPTLATRQDAA
jgi:carbon-monoxide dehydrogenase large subunit